jgi:PAS domain-containing protein
MNNLTRHSSIANSEGLECFPDRDPHYFQRLFKLNPAPILICNDECLVEFNPATLKMFDVPLGGSIFGLQLSDLSPEFQPNGALSKQMYRDLLLEAKANETANIECLCKKFSNGSTFPVEVVVSLLKLPEKLVYQVTLLDLSHYQHWQNALETNKEIVELTLKSVDSAVITAANDGRITYMNEPACDLTEWLLHDAVGEQVALVVNVVDVDTSEGIEIYKPFSIAKNKTVVMPQGAVLISKSGERHSIRGTAATHGLSDAANIGCVITLIKNTERESDDGEMQWHATHDELTKLPNRTLLADRFKQALFSASRHKTMLAVCMMDLDEFKPDNDTYGHAAGDLLLIEVGSRLKKCLRQDDT